MEKSCSYCTGAKKKRNQEVRASLQCVSPEEGSQGVSLKHNQPDEPLSPDVKEVAMSSKAVPGGGHP